jgi:hypothetical protein
MKMRLLTQIPGMTLAVMSTLEREIGVGVKFHNRSQTGRALPV